MNPQEILAPEEAVIIIKKGYLYLSLFLTFILGSHNGYIALWQDGAAEPVKVFPYSVASLPSADQKALEEGIRIDNKTDLIKLLEDYLS